MGTAPTTGAETKTAGVVDMFREAEVDPSGCLLVIVDCICRVGSIVIAIIANRKVALGRKALPA
jgi:hypothetical protein